MKPPHPLDDLSLSVSFEDNTPTPPGWTRKLVPRIGNSLFPASIDVVFIGPTGEKFKTRSQIQKYLNANKGSPDLSEFIWITEDCPRRLTRSASSNPSTDASPSKVLRKTMPVQGDLKENTKSDHGRYQSPVDKLSSNRVKVNNSKRKASSSLSAMHEMRRSLRKDSKKRRNAPSRRKARSTKVIMKDETKEVVEQTSKSEKREITESEVTKDVEKHDSVDCMNDTKSRILESDQTIALMQALCEAMESDKEIETGMNGSDGVEKSNPNGSIVEDCHKESK